NSGCCGIYSLAATASVLTIADTSGPFTAFHGLPVINLHGSIAFRADLRDGGQGIFTSSGGDPVCVAGNRGLFSELGLFPSMNSRGAVAFAATLRDGGPGIFVAANGSIETAIDSSAGFEHFRGAVINEAGTIIFFATPKRGALGIYCGPDPAR